MTEFHDMRITGALRVDGWLDAPNIKHFLKGLFPDIESLVAAYPRPLPGWAALVGRSLPADIYIASSGVWRASGGTAGISLPAQQLSPSLSLSSPLSPIPCFLSSISPQSERGRYVDIKGKIAFSEDMRITSPISLQPGDILTARLDTAGIAWPIAIVTADGSYHLPPVGDISKGNRIFSFHAEEECEVVLSSCSPIADAEIAPNQLALRLSWLKSINGITMHCRPGDMGGRLLTDGTLDATRGYGVSAIVPLGSVRLVHYRGYMDSTDGKDTAFAIFYAGDGRIVATHYVGDSPSEIGKKQYPAGELDCVLTAPTGATHARFCHLFTTPALFAVTSR